MFGAWKDTELCTETCGEGKVLEKRSCTPTHPDKSCAILPTAETLKPGKKTCVRDPCKGDSKHYVLIYKGDKNKQIYYEPIIYRSDKVEYEYLEEKEFNIRKLRAIEGVMITQGKKTEAIELENVDGNKAVNLSRQIYAKIPGLNIWESDGAGIQLGLGGRGLNPSRNSNFNTRQNGYDISADALGYPESYYSPPSEAIKEIQFIRGAASLQFGPQFGGLINFKLKDGNTQKKLETTLRHTTGSFGLNNTFISVGGNINKWNYYCYGNYKFGNEWRENSEFDLKNTYKFNI